MIFRQEKIMTIVYFCARMVYPLLDSPFNQTLLVTLFSGTGTKGLKKGQI